MILWFNVLNDIISYVIKILPDFVLFGSLKILYLQYFKLFLLTDYPLVYGRGPCF